MKKELKYALWGLAALFVLAMAVIAGAAGGVLYMKYALASQEKEFAETQNMMEDSIADVIEEHVYLNEETTDSLEPEITEEAAETDESSADAKEEAVVDDQPLTLDAEIASKEAAEVSEQTSVVEDKRPMLAIVIDDMGVNQRRTKDMLKLEAPLTSSFLTYGRDLRKLTAEALKAGHEVMLHAAMEPRVPANLAPDTLKTDMNESQIETTFQKMLDKFDGLEIKGVNNHMGSKFTEDKEKFGYVMAMIKKRGMYFLDSKTTAATKGPELAAADQVPFVVRDVFLDNKNERAHIEKQLQEVEQLAKKRGFAVAICHPKSETFIVLKEWLKTLPEKEIRLVHLGEIVSASAR